MRIDIHAHTKKVKSGDSENRNITPQKFIDIIKNTDVKIIAITNHNHFDLTQYNEIVKLADTHIQVWPGVELDIIEGKKRGHLLVIVNPKYSVQLSNTMESLLKEKTEENFDITIENVIKEFDKLDPIYIPHYYAKKPDLTDNSIEKITTLISNKNRIIKEATNSISAGIYISHGHKTIYGSDVQSWDNYIEDHTNLPELRLPVESYEQFCFLLDKDDTTIKSILAQKNFESITVVPFENNDTVTLNIYDDINIFFGSKGTGKSKILEALSRHYNDKGLKTSIHSSNNESIFTNYDINCNHFDIDIEDIGLEPCSEEFSFFKEAKEKNVTSISSYEKYFSSEITNKIVKKLIIKDYPIEDYEMENRKFTNANKVKEKFNTFIELIKSNETIKEIVSRDKISKLLIILKDILDEINDERLSRFSTSRSTLLFNSIISTFTLEISKKTGSPSKPLTTGFLEYARNRIKIEVKVNKIISNLETLIKNDKLFVGNLGRKGDLYCTTEIKVQNGRINDGNFKTIKNTNKKPQKEFSTHIFKIRNSLYLNNLFEEISSLLEINGFEEIKSIKDLLLVYRYFSINDRYYKPSSGESSMVLLHKVILP